MSGSASCSDTDFTGKSAASGASGATPAAPNAQTAKNRADALMMRALRVDPSSDNKRELVKLCIGFMQSVKICRLNFSGTRYFLLLSGVVVFVRQYLNDRGLYQTPEAGHHFSKNFS